MPVSSRRTLAVALHADELIGVAGNESLQFEIARSTAHVEPLIAGDALVIATSGSTGTPKGVVHTHHSLHTHAQMIGARLTLSSADHWWLCLPPAHIGGFGVLARAWQFGARLTLSDVVSDATLSEALAAGATHTSVVPTHLTRHSFANWQVVLVGGARADKLLPNCLSTYGLTETGGGVVYDGVPLVDVEIRVTDGDIHLRTPTLARTYRHAPLNTVDGWFDTGDVGVLTNGKLTVEGRVDDLIITGGNKVWPRLVEQRLLEHPLVDEVVVRGVPDAQWGAAVCVWVRPTNAANAPTLEVLRGHVKETLASYYAPQRMVLVESIPRSALGKVLVSELPGSAT